MIDLRWVIRVGSATVTLLLGSTSAPAIGPEGWRYMEHENVSILSQMSDSITREIFRDVFLFPYMMEAFLGTDLENNWPIRIIVVNDSQLASELRGIEGELVGGFFVHMPGYDLIVLNHHNFISGNDLRDVIYHEYTHRLFNRDNLPPWANEGIAQYFENIEYTDKYINQGKADFVAVEMLILLGFLPWEEFFSAKSVHQEGNEMWTSKFYPQAYILTQYFMTELGPEMREKYLRFITSDRAHDFTEKDFEAHFGWDYKKLTRKIRSHFKKAAFNYFRMPYDVLPEIPERSPRTPTQAEIDTLFAGAFARVDDLNKEPYPQRSIQLLSPHLDPGDSDPRPFAEAHMIFRRWGDHEEANKYARLAYERGSKNPGVLRQMAMLLNAQMPAYPRAPLPKDIVIEASTLSREILSWDPTNTLAWRLLIKACGYSKMKIEFQEDLEFLAAGANLLKEDPSVQLAYAVILSKTPYRHEGEKRIEAVLEMQDLPAAAREQAEWIRSAVFR